MSELLIEAKDLVKEVRDGERTLRILDGVSVSLASGERVALLGPSGSGKSTLLHILGALDPDYRGSVRIGGQTLSEMSDGRRAAFRNRELGFVFQAYNLLGQLTALENVLLPTRFSEAHPDVARAKETLASVGLGEKTHRRPHQLSGGERQRVAIARALMQKPKLVLCDEPTGNLDQETGRHVLALFDRLTHEGVGLLIATHDEAIADSAHRVLRVREGRLA
jgi:putative ABC transport system ATP-binding protein